MKVIGADMNPDADADLVTARLYHDCWTFENKRNMIYVSMTQSTILTIDQIGGNIDSEIDNVSITLGTAFTGNPNHKFYFLDTGASTAVTAPAVYDIIDVSSWTPITVGTEVNEAADTGNYVRVIMVDADNRVIAHTAIAAG
jgi:hypothetical protein